MVKIVETELTPRRRARLHVRRTIGYGHTRASASIGRREPDAPNVLSGGAGSTAAQETCPGHSFTIIANGPQLFRLARVVRERDK